MIQTAKHYIGVLSFVLVILRIFDGSFYTSISELSIILITTFVFDVIFSFILVLIELKKEKR